VLTKGGEQLLDAADEGVDAVEARMLADVSGADRRALSALLGAAQAGLDRIP
jgi:hypothetical protein